MAARASSGHNRVNALTIDVEDWFQVQALEGAVSRDSWDRRELRVARNTERILGLLSDAGCRATFFILGWIARREPALLRRIADAGHEVASHGWRWFDYQDMGIAEERRHMKLAIEAIEKACGERPVGWYTGRLSASTRRLVIEEGGFLYDSDSYADDLPYWVEAGRGRGHLVVPYTFDCNDMKFATLGGFATGEDFFAHLRDSFDVLYREGQQGHAKMMTIGLHCRLAGRPGRAAALARFLDYVQRHDHAWVCRRVDIARHWHATHPYRKD